MALPDFSMRQLLEAGVHFGHQTHRWNPQMSPYIYGARNKVHIIDLSQTVPHLYRALEFVRTIVSGGGRVLFVGTKRQASGPLAESAKRSGQYYVNHRWLGGMLTNWQTISNSIKRLKSLDELLAQEDSGLTKKEQLQMSRQRDKLERSLGGIREMGGLPDVIFVIDTNREAIAIREANTLNIPVVAVLDTNCDPDGIAFPIPGNDDATRAIQLYCDLLADAVLDGLQAEQVGRGVDLGAQEAPSVDADVKAAEETKPEEKKEEAKAKAEPAEKKENPAAKAKTEEKPGEKPEAVKTEAQEKPASKKTPAKKTAPAKKAAAVKKEDTAKKAPVKKTAAAKKDEAAEKPAAKKAPAKKATPAKKAAATKTAAKKPAAKKAPAKKTTKKAKE